MLSIFCCRDIFWPCEAMRGREGHGGGIRFFHFCLVYFSKKSRPRTASRGLARPLAASHGLARPLAASHGLSPRTTSQKNLPNIVKLSTRSHSLARPIAASHGLSRPLAASHGPIYKNHGLSHDPTKSFAKFYHETICKILPKNCGFRTASRAAFQYSRECKSVAEMARSGFLWLQSSMSVRFSPPTP